MKQLYADPGDNDRIRQKIDQKGFVRDYEVKLRKKNGVVMDCLVTATDRRSQDDRMLGYQSIIRDITERKAHRKKDSAKLSYPKHYQSIAAGVPRKYFAERDSGTIH